MANWILLLVTAKDCGGCKTFLTRWPEIKSPLLTGLAGKCELLEVVNEKKSTPVDASKYPQDLNRFIPFYPCFVLVSSESWVEGKKSPTNKLMGAVFNGVLDPVSTRWIPKPDKDRTPVSAPMMLAWVDNTIKELQAPPKPTAPPPPAVTPTYCDRVSPFAPRFGSRYN